jgi:hypothetical protein
MTDLIASTRAELLRLRKWPAMWIMLIVWLLLNLTFGYVFPYLTYKTGDTVGPAGEPAQSMLDQVLPAAIPHEFVAGMPLFGGALMLTLGALATGSGYGWGTWKTVFTQGPGRLSSFGGTLAALASVVVGTVLLTLVSDFVWSLTLAAVEGQSIVWPAFGDLATSVGGGMLIFAMWAMAGVFVGTLAKGPALAVGLGLVWTLVLENLLRGVGSLLDWLEKITDVFPGTVAGSLAGATGATPVGDPDGTPGVLDVFGGGAATVATLAYIVAFAGLAALLVRRRDLV